MRQLFFTHNPQVCHKKVNFDFLIQHNQQEQRRKKPNYSKSKQNLKSFVLTELCTIIYVGTFYVSKYFFIYECCGNTKYKVNLIFEKKVDAAMNQIFKYIEECQFSLTKLKSVLTTEHIPDVKTIKME